MTQKQGQTKYDLEERTFEFARRSALFCKKLPKSVTNIEYLKQLIRSSGSVGANYIEANESLGEKDFLMRIKICRKEAKESIYWIKLIIDTSNAIEDSLLENSRWLLDEATQLNKIFSSIIKNKK